MDRLSALETFVCVVEQAGFTAAAKQLNLPKSAVSRRISELEAHLGLRLLHRTTRKLSLTGAGRECFEWASHLVEEVAAGEERLASGNEQPRGRLRVQAPMSFGHLHLAPALGAFIARYPDIDIELDLRDQVVDLIDDGSDLAIRITSGADPTLESTYLGPARIVVCASPGYLERHGRPGSPADLAAHNCLHYSQIPAQAQWRFRDGGGSGLRLSGSLSSNNGDALRQAALSGVGITTLPTFIVGDDLRGGTLVALLDPYGPPVLDIQAVHPPNPYLPARTAAFIAFCRERFGQEPYWDRA